MKVSHAFLLVDDYDKAKRFYTEVLGFEVDTDYVGEGFRWLSLTAGEGGAELVFTQADDEAAKAYLVARRNQGPAFSLTISGTEEFEQIRERGAVVVMEPSRQEYGGTDALIDDGCGNIVNLHSEE